jgi:hypothetical protein
VGCPRTSLILEFLRESGARLEIDYLADSYGRNIFGKDGESDDSAFAKAARDEETNRTGRQRHIACACPKARSPWRPT